MIHLKKIVLLGAIIFLLSGCTVDYNLTIEGNSFKEDITVYTTNVSSLDEIQPSYYNRTYRTLFDTIRQMPIGIYYDADEPLYNRTLIDEENRYGANFTNDFTFADLARSNAINKCYNPSDIILTADSDIYTLRTVSSCQLFEYEEIFKELNIKITVNNYVLSNNADSVDGNTYTWTINRDNYNNKTINISYDTTREPVITSTTEETNSNSIISWIIDNIPIVAGGLLVIITIICVIIIDSRNKKKIN